MDMEGITPKKQTGLSLTARILKKVIKIISLRWQKICLRWIFMFLLHRSYLLMGYIPLRAFGYTELL